MSLVIPAGNKSLNWVPQEPKNTKLTKTAAIGEEIGEEVVEYDSRDALYNAAKEVIDASNEDKDEAEGVGCGQLKGSGNGPLDGTGCGPRSIADESPSEVIEDIAEDVAVDGVQDAVEQVEEAVGQIEEAVGALKENVEGVDALTEDENVEIEVELEVSDEVSDGVVDDAGEVVDEVVEVTDEVVDDVVDNKEDDLIVESTEEEDEIAMDKSASVGEEFCKFSKLSPQTRNKVLSYWKDALNYPADYVALMVKDYQK